MPSRVAAADTRAAKPPPKEADPFYRTTDWKSLRDACLKRDGYRCAVLGCNQRAFIADHVVSRKNGGTDTLENLRSVCRLHDNRAKEDHLGVRRGEGGFRR